MMVYMLIILMLVKYRHDIINLVPQRKLKDDPLEHFGGLNYEPTIEKKSHLRVIK